jgi:hypothetical protein
MCLWVIALAAIGEAANPAIASAAIASLVLIMRGTPCLDHQQKKLLERRTVPAEIASFG